ncbi:hypothetical protein GOZ80_12335 [Agrobacterium vitis]|nr:hypothetical protein [Agrobacterium vitis]MUO94505.1 hypothetical protein [Agrobacterium vitis]MVA92792.1 hypothetical protein [Agrobacterium vitis]MVB01845.1 hypothetical protein [Agrobacterium vitis]NSY14608.1 hypothetical protein [Agrobacterium vitis]NSY24365.1 hypothetical protein [Agrobacterium vitis]
MLYPVRFVYRRSSVKFGSTTMRSFQLSRLTRPYLGDKYRFEMAALPNKRIPGLQMLWASLQPKDAIYVFTKRAALSIGASALEILHGRSRGICFDYVDTPLDKMVFNHVDMHLASSHMARDAMRARLTNTPGAKGQVGLLLHGADERIYAMGNQHRNDYRAGYFGFLKNTVRTPQIEKSVDFHDAAFSDSMRQTITRMGDYSLHYCIRAPQKETLARCYKPFTKGVIAAACGANVLVNAAQDDALAFLGEDYPYLVQGDGEDEIIDVLQRARSTHGKNDWLCARRAMDNLLNQVSPKAMAMQMDEIFTTLLR